MKIAKQAFVLLVLFSFISGCAGTQYRNVNSARNNQVQFNQDEAYCNAVAVGNIPMPVPQGGTRFTTGSGMITDSRGNMYMATYSQTTYPDFASSMANLGNQLEAIGARMTIFSQCLAQLGWREISKQEYEAMNNRQANPLIGIQQAAEQGDSQAQFHLGALYLVGQGVSQDYAKAIYWIQKAAEQGNVEAQYTFGIAYCKGDGVGKDESKAIYWIQKAAEQGHAGAQYALGNMYGAGFGITKDYAKAIYWAQKAAEQGHVEAQYTLGIVYGRGDGVGKDESKAIYWIQKAADQNHAIAQDILGDLYYHGFGGVTKDKKQAEEWYRKAAVGLHKLAEQGNAEAQYRLANSYFQGAGVDKNEDKGMELMQKAASQGYQPAQDVLKKMKQADKAS